MNMKKVLLTGLLALFVLGGSATSVEAGKIQDIQARGYLLVGTTGDYKPMSYYNAESGQYEGFDAEASELLAKSLGVKVQYVPTTWPTLTKDTLDGKFDMAMCGITRTFPRQQIMSMSHGYLVFGKTILVRKGTEHKYKTLEDMNKKEVRVMVNPGGTNEKFVHAHLDKTTIIVHNQNAEIPGLIGEGKADIMITETMEARRYVRDNPKLSAPLINKPFTKSQFGILMPQGDSNFLNYVNMWMEEMELNGTFEKLEDKYIK